MSVAGEKLTDTLELIVGSARRFEITVLDDRGNPEALSAFDRASVTVREYVGASTAILQVDTVGGDLSIDVPNGLLVGNPSQAKADALVAGTFIGQYAVRVAATAKWFQSDPFRVVISPAIAAKP